MGQGSSSSSTAVPAPTDSFKRLTRDEVQLLFSFLDWRSKLALARCSRQLFSDADSVLAWKDSDGLSAFSSAGVIDLNLVRMPDVKTVELVLNSLAGRRGRVHLQYDHRTFGEGRCLRSRQLPVGTCRRIAESLPRLHGLGPFCRSCSGVEEWTLLLPIVPQLKRPLSELRLDDFRDPHSTIDVSLLARAVNVVFSPTMAPHLRALSLTYNWKLDDDPRGETYTGLVQLPQLTQLECNSDLWVGLVEHQPRAALYDQLLSLSIFCYMTRLDSLCHALCSSGMSKLRVLRLYGWLQPDDAAAPTSSRHWAALCAIIAAVGNPCAPFRILSRAQLNSAKTLPHRRAGRRTGAAHAVIAHLDRGRGKKSVS
jgi:hypothetical protein